MTDYADRGKWAEKQAQDWLVAMSNAYRGFAFHRLPDARAARGALAPQPADFIVAAEWWKPIYLEVKETKEPKRLPREKISQYGKLKMFYWAGMPPRVLVYRSLSKLWTFLTEDELFPVEGGKDAPPPTSYLVDRGPQFGSAADALQTIFCMKP
jgi:hypothetical protein